MILLFVAGDSNGGRRIPVIDVLSGLAHHIVSSADKKFSYVLVRTRNVSAVYMASLFVVWNSCAIAQSSMIEASLSHIAELP